MNYLVHAQHEVHGGPVARARPTYLPPLLLRLEVLVLDDEEELLLDEEAVLHAT